MELSLLALVHLFVGREGPDQWNGLSPVIRPVSHLLPIRHLIICDFYTIHTKSRHLNVNKNNCHFAKFIFGFCRCGILPDWLNNRYYPTSLKRIWRFTDLVNSAVTSKDIFFI